jgi:hypothetical protein
MGFKKRKERNNIRKKEYLKKKEYLSRGSPASDPASTPEPVSPISLFSTPSPDPLPEPTPNPIRLKLRINNPSKTIYDYPLNHRTIIKIGNKFHGKVHKPFGGFIKLDPCYSEKEALMTWEKVVKEQGPEVEYFHRIPWNKGQRGRLPKLKEGIFFEAEKGYINFLKEKEKEMESFEMERRKMQDEMERVEMERSEMETWEENERILSEERERIEREERERMKREEEKKLKKREELKKKKELKLKKKKELREKINHENEIKNLRINSERERENIRINSERERENIRINFEREREIRRINSEREREITRINHERYMKNMRINHGKDMEKQTKSNNSLNETCSNFHNDLRKMKENVDKLDTKDCFKDKKKWTLFNSLHGIVNLKKNYQTLGFSDMEMNLEIIKKKRDKLALVYHPDKNIGNESEAKVKFNKIFNAYNVIKAELMKLKKDK